MYTIKELQELKRKYGFSYKEISDHCALSISTVQKALGGINKTPRMDTLSELTKAYEKIFLEAGIANPVTAGGITYDNTGSQPGYVADKNPYYSRGSSALLTGAGSGGGLIYTQHEYTYDDYEKLQLPPGKRVEIIDGEIFDMAAPTATHQMTVGFFFMAFSEFIKKNKGKCIVLLSPSDVRLDYDRGDKTVLQPDLMVICDREKLEDKKAVKGAPDFVLEVISPATRKLDTNVKLKKYRECGVREYWIVDCEAETLIKNVFEGVETTAIYTFEDTVSAGMYDDKLQINLRELKEYLEI